MLIYLQLNIVSWLQVVSVGFIKAGEAHNVIPESVTFGGTFRSMTSEGLSHLSTRIKEVTCTLLEQDYGAKNLK